MRDPIERLLLSRRRLVLGAVASLPLLQVGAALSAVDPPATMDRFAVLERRLRGRLGVAALDTSTGRRIEYRAAELFPLCSTFKLLLVALILARIDAGEETLVRRITYSRADLLEYAPITSKQVAAGGMSVEALCAAAMQYSDNTAANLLLDTCGGPDGLTRYLRTLGDDVTRLDRIEPELNSAQTGDARDTTSPAAMCTMLGKILLGDALSVSSRELLLHWLQTNTTGNERLRAGIPAGWRTGDKTGTGENGTSNDVAIVFPPQRKPLLVAAYCTGSSAGNAERNAALAQVGRIVATLFA